ncbi:uncharacterized protein FSUBG_1065 [Fusarium subglutinans]|uniref:Uncharacterized protein n=1 Tax=Gibberella subglutinans TaxID=42677 RepID=A0A8H5QAM0_GIBSU|nr:uncharacterized protein FSUBG_1065 [Fusarium subglutinans]KAF5612835.1 hypothetical protein FSUBG_1065 [Fusarium subglutinans]
MPRGRPAYLPAQEDITNTYMDEQYMPGGAMEVDQITANSTESHVSAAWTTILACVFSRWEGWAVNQEHNVPGGRLDMKVSHKVGRTSLNFLVLELKGAAQSTSPVSLSRYEEQLKGYLLALGNTENELLWGALCVGKNVQFYQLQKIGWDEGYLNSMHEALNFFFLLTYIHPSYSSYSSFILHTQSPDFFSHNNIPNYSSSKPHLPHIMANQAHTVDSSGDHVMTPPPMSQGEFENAINRAIEVAINKALSGLHEYIPQLVDQKIAAEKENLCVAVAAKVVAQLEKTVVDA